MTDRDDYHFGHETARFIETARALLRLAAASTASGTDDVWAQATDDRSAGLATGTPECRLCPFCQLLGFARHARPEIFEHLVAASEEMFSAVREAFEAHERAWPTGEPRDVQHIDVD